MARKGLVQTNLNRIRLVKKYADKRAALKSIVMSKVLPMEEKFLAQMKLAELPRNSSAVRVRNRCELTGRSRGYYRRFKMSRICLREMASYGLLPGVRKSSW